MRIDVEHSSSICSYKNELEDRLIRRLMLIVRLILMRSDISFSTWEYENSHFETSIRIKPTS